MDRKHEALNLAVMEMRKDASTRKARREALAAAQIADVTTLDYLRAHALLAVTAGECAIAELAVTENWMKEEELRQSSPSTIVALTATTAPRS